MSSVICALSGIGELDALIHLALLQRSEQQADRRQARRVLGAHRGLHVFGDSCFERHPDRGDR